MNRRRADPAELDAVAIEAIMLLWILSSGGICTLCGALGLGHFYQLDNASKGIALIVSVITAMIFFAAMDIRDERLAARLVKSD